MVDLKELKEMARDISILYVEDNAQLRGVFSDYLAKFFPTVTACNNGEEGLALYKQTPHDIIITDINMPKMNGLEMAEKIKAINVCQKIIVISAYKHLENYIEAIRVGIDGYILKPIEYTQLNTLLYKVARNVKNIKENEQYKNKLESMLAQKSEELKKQFVTDQLTALYNKVALEQMLHIDTSKTMLLLNIDNFDRINENYSFEIADSVLKEVALKLKMFESSDFILYRVQGDIFAFLGVGECVQKLYALAQNIQEFFLNNSIELYQLKLTISFTMAIDTGNHKDLLRTTALSIKSQRETHKGGIAIYEPNSAFECQQKDNLFWIEKVKEYLRNDQLCVFFQPIYDLKLGKTQKYEVLARMISRDKSVIAPAKFLKAIELANLTTTLTRRVIDKSFQALQNRDFILSINITEQDLKENYLQDCLVLKTKEYNINPENITLEVLSKCPESISYYAKI